MLIQYVGMKTFSSVYNFAACLETLLLLTEMLDIVADRSGIGFCLDSWKQKVSEKNLVCIHTHMHARTHTHTHAHTHTHTHTHTYIQTPPPPIFAAVPDVLLVLLLLLCSKPPTY